MEKPIYKCPHCAKCCAIADECDEAMFVNITKTRPPPRQHSVRMLANRRCAKCKMDFVVECYTSISTLLRWLILTDPDAIGQELFEKNMDLIEKLRADEKFMTLLNA